MRRAFIALFYTIIISHFASAAVGYKLSKGEYGGSTSTTRPSAADLKRRDDEATTSLVGKKASSDGQNKTSAADLKKLDEKALKEIEAFEQRKRQLDRQILQMTSAPAKKSIDQNIADAAMEYALDAVKDAWSEAIFGKFAGPIGVIVDIVNPKMTGKDPYDLARNKRELEYVAKRLEELFPSPFKQSGNSPQTERPSKPDASDKPQNSNLAPSNVNAIFRNPAMAGEISKLNDGLKTLASLSSLPEAEIPLQRLLNEVSSRGELDQTQVNGLEELTRRLGKLRKANACFVSRRDPDDEDSLSQICTIGDIAQDQRCLCPELRLDGYTSQRWSRGVTRYISVSDFCKSPVGRCNLPSPGALGTPCICFPDYELIGPLPIGEISRRE